MRRIVIGSPVAVLLLAAVFAAASPAYANGGPPSTLEKVCRALFGGGIWDDDFRTCLWGDLFICPANAEAVLVNTGLGIGVLHCKPDAATAGVV